MGKAATDKPGIAEVYERLDELAGLAPGRVACVEVRGRPWRLNWIVSVQGGVVTVDSGHQYALQDGAPLFDSRGHCLRPLTRERAGYLLLLELRKQAEKLDVARLSAAQREALLPAALAVLGVLREGKAPEGATGPEGEPASDDPMQGVITFDNPWR